MKFLILLMTCYLMDPVHHFSNQTFDLNFETEYVKVSTIDEIRINRTFLVWNDRKDVERVTCEFISQGRVCQAKETCESLVEKINGLVK